MTVLDLKKNPLNVQIDYRCNGSHSIVFYPSIILVNNSESPVAFYSKHSGQMKLVAGQVYDTNIIVCNSTKRIAIGLSHTKSKSFKIKSVGV